MERKQAFTVENFIGNWNEDFPNYALSAQDLKSPRAMMGALLQIFDRLGIDRDVVLAPPPEDSRNEHMIYYWDLLPVINMTRVINHLVSVIPKVDATISVTHLLQPTSTTSHSILLLLFNLMVFYEGRLRDVAPHEEELFAKTEHVKTLEDKKNLLLEMLNEQAVEKGKRAERLEKLDHDVKQLEDELKHEKERYDLEKQELDIMMKENRQGELLVEQKKSQRDALMAEVTRKKALRVYDADDIKAQAEQASQSVQEADEKLNSLSETLKQKESSLKNLQTIKPHLDSANNLLHEIMKLSDNIKQLETGSSETEERVLECEMRSAQSALDELCGQLGELQASRASHQQERSLAAQRRQHDTNMAHSALREAEEKDKRCREACKKALHRTEELKALSLQHEQEKASALEQLNNIQNTFTTQLKSVEDAIKKRTAEVQKRLEDQVKNHNVAHSALREVEEKDKRCREKSKKELTLRTEDSGRLKN